MQVTYDGTHSLLIGDFINGQYDESGFIHTWKDWHLIPKSLPIISPPPVQTQTLQIPGMNGSIDMTSTMLGFPLYENRTGSIEFYVDHTAENWDWDIAYDTIINAIHGYTKKVILTDTPSFYYEGRLSVNNWKSDKTCCSIVIDYDFTPFRRMLWSTAEDWLWNPFDFRYGLLIDKNDFVFTRDSAVGDYAQDPYPGTVWDSDYIGHMPVTPTFIVSSTDGKGMAIHYKNYNAADDSKSIHSESYDYALPDGITSNPLIMFATPRMSDRVRFQISGHGTMTIDFRPGRL